MNAPARRAVRHKPGDARQGEHAAKPPLPLDWTQRSIRISEVLRNGFVSFDFIVGDPDIYVEMLLSPEAFAQFCDDQGLEPDDRARDASDAAFPHIDLRDAARLCSRQQQDIS